MLMGPSASVACPGAASIMVCLAAVVHCVNVTTAAQCTPLPPPTQSTGCSGEQIVARQRGSVCLAHCCACCCSAAHVTPAAAGHRAAAIPARHNARSRSMVVHRAAQRRRLSRTAAAAFCAFVVSLACADAAQPPLSRKVRASPQGPTLVTPGTLTRCIACTDGQTTAQDDRASHVIGGSVAT